MTTHALSQEQAKLLIESLDVERWSKPVTLESGHVVRAKLGYDTDNTIEGRGDTYGKFYPLERVSPARPAACNGAARKIETRSGQIWWQPPADVVSDAAGLASVEKRVREYFLEYWSFVGLVLEVQSPHEICCALEVFPGSHTDPCDSGKGP